MKLHLGCGKRDFGPSWIHIDKDHFPHIQWYSVTKLPFVDESIAIIYASHLLEYFDREQIPDILGEWHRVLISGGVLRLAVPDLEDMAALYAEGKPLEMFLGPLYGRMNSGGEFIYHRTVFDFRSLRRVLEEADFRDVEEYDWRKTDHAQFDDCSQAYIPHMDKENGTLISLNVEARKP